jgi:hypothetical protein
MGRQGIGGGSHRVRSDGLCAVSCGVDGVAEYYVSSKNVIIIIKKNKLLI